MIVSGQPNPQSEQRKAKPFAWFGMAGHTDFNLMEVKKIDEQLARASTPMRRRSSWHALLVWIAWWHCSNSGSSRSAGGFDQG